MLIWLGKQMLGQNEKVETPADAKRLGVHYAAMMADISDPKAEENDRA